MVERFGRNMSGMVPDPDGKYVRHSDHLAELSALKKQVEELTAERDDARRYAVEARLRENQAEDRRISESFARTKAEIRPLYASPLPVRPITDEDVERAGEWRDPNSGFTYTAAELAALLEHRDSFIVSHGLWSEYVASLDARAALEAVGRRG